MVGGGLSRCAVKARPDAGDAPLWYDLATELTKRLYPRPDSEGQPAEPGDKPTTGDLLSLAQEYETAFGRRDLHLFLQQQIRDGDFTPGGVHEQLMRLPWRDVFTTNWDTLLERTGPEVVDRGYNTVVDKDQIPLANRPRIVKLHGSLPAQFPLIFTEEDYRTYPTKFAPFVNTVQQAMMETVFCLIGFQRPLPGKVALHLREDDDQVQHRPAHGAILIDGLPQADDLDLVLPQPALQIQHLGHRPARAVQRPTFTQSPGCKAAFKRLSAGWFH